MQFGSCFVQIFTCMCICCSSVYVTPNTHMHVHIFILVFSIYMLKNLPQMEVDMIYLNFLLYFYTW